MLEEFGIKKNASEIKFLRPRKTNIIDSESYSKFIFMSKDFAKNFQGMSDGDLNFYSSFLAKQINEIQLEIILESIEQQGKMPEFNQFLINNLDLNIWTAIEQFNNQKSLDKETKTSQEYFSPD